MSNGIIKGQEGVTLIEVLVAVLLGGIAIYVAEGFFGSARNTANAAKKASVRDEIITVLRRNVDSKWAILKTSDNNPNFRSCIGTLIGQGGGCSNGQLQPLALSDPQGNPISGGDGDFRYNMDAKHCNPGSYGCLFRVTTFFRPHCAPAGPCAEYIEIFYKITADPENGVPAFPEFAGTLYLDYTDMLRMKGQ